MLNSPYYYEHKYDNEARYYNRKYFEIATFVLFLFQIEPKAILFHFQHFDIEWIVFLVVEYINN